MIHLAIYAANIAGIAFLSHKLFLLARQTWAEGIEVVVPIILEEPASTHYDAGDLVAYLVSTARQNVPGSRWIQ